MEEVIVLSEKDRELSSMANLLRKGATMTSLSCPACFSPIFRLKKGKLWCEQCKKNVILERNKGKETDSENQLVLHNLESTILAKIQTIDSMMKNENNAKQLLEFSRILTFLLENLEKLWRLKNRQ
jgi:UPF0148 protein